MGFSVWIYCLASSPFFSFAQGDASSRITFSVIQYTFKVSTSGHSTATPRETLAFLFFILFFSEKVSKNMINSFRFVQGLNFFNLSALTDEYAKTFYG